MVRWLINAVTLLVVAHLVPGIEVAGGGAVIVAALVLGLLNALLRPVLLIVTLPINIMTLGIFTFFINAFMLYAVSRIVQGFVVAGFWSAFWGALLFSVVNFLLNLFIGASSLAGSVFHIGRRGHDKGVIDVDAYATKDEKDKKLK